MANDTKLRVALCISGQPRSFEEAYPYIKKNIIDKHPGIDIFLHCWYSPTDAGKRFAHTSDTVREEGINVIPKQVPERLQELYAPVKMLVEPQEDFTSLIREEYTQTRDKTNPFATFSMWTSIKRCNDLKIAHEKASGFVYDIVIKCRYDVKLTHGLNDFDASSALHTSYVSVEKDTVEDILFYAPSVIMNTICTLPTELDTHFKALGRWNNEMLLARHCAAHAIPVQAHPEWRRFTLVRGRRSLSDTIWYFIRRIRTKLGI